jgi:threonine/homoserine/homoserine lactone efflux protein
MLWLAWKIATSGPVGNDPMQPAKSRPLTFVQAALFQWVNPKALVMAVAATAAYTQPGDYFASLMIVALVFGAINAPCVSVWTLFGLAMRRVLRDARNVRVFNFAMAALLIVSFLPLVTDLIELV